jgi:hypothetical protein
MEFQMRPLYFLAPILLMGACAYPPEQCPMVKSHSLACSCCKASNSGDPGSASDFIVSSGAANRALDGINARHTQRVLRRNIEDVTGGGNHHKHHH